MLRKQKQKQQQNPGPTTPRQWFFINNLQLFNSLLDGSCFFDSMQQLIRNCPQSNKEQALKLRKQVVESLRNSLQIGDSSLENSIKGLLGVQNFRHVDTVENYLNTMCQNNTFADEIEIAQTAKLYQCVIWVYDIRLSPGGQWKAPTPSQIDTNWPIRYPPEITDTRPVYKILRYGEHFQPLFTEEALGAYRENRNQCTGALRDFQEYQYKRVKNESSLGVLFMVVLGAAGLGVLVGFNT